ncbi:MAG: tRNA pseudouridine(55) synthase TruB [Spirochaetaceae bacterium]|jgi:tRNA pseudouridine55 synthase|nr:tRNA pseudouridine(55) synthase TruB [Spirochaetaceae bacterium]
MDSLSGLLLLDKAPGLTSFQALEGVKRLFSTSRVGHTGTLDKFASGLLPVLVGWAVKLAPWFSGLDKHYEALIRFGEETATLDPEGEVLASAPPPDREALERVLPRFRGTLAQKPPAYSALRVDGKRAHRLARAGAAPDMPEREVTIHELELCSYEPPLARIRVHCSKGTYIRSLARDIALAAGSRAHLAELKRTQAGAFRLEEALELEALRGDAGRAALLPLDAGLFARLGVPSLVTGAGGERRLLSGQSLEALFRSGELRPEDSAGDGADLAVFGPGGFAALIRRAEGRWTYACVRPREAGPAYS